MAGADMVAWFVLPSLAARHSVCGGTGSFDACGYCYQKNDRRRIEVGQGGPDACGNCLLYSSPSFNKVCCLQSLVSVPADAHAHAHSPTLPLFALTFAVVRGLRQRAQQRQGS